MGVCVGWGSMAVWGGVERDGESRVHGGWTAVRENAER